MATLPDQRPLPEPLVKAMSESPASDESIVIVREFFKQNAWLITDARFTDWLRRERERVVDWSERNPVEKRS